MSDCPEIATYRIENGPCAAEWLARFVDRKQGDDGKIDLRLYGPTFQGDSEQQASQAARSFWFSEYNWLLVGEDR